MPELAPQTVTVPVTFTAKASGRVQFARTGSGFYRRDHGKPFSIDEDLLRLLLRNTQIRRRPIRIDFMHWANCDLGEELGDYGKAGEADPAVLEIAPWVEPTTGAAGFGIFGPAAWTEAGEAGVEAGIDEISPVIDWAYTLPEDTPEFPAGTVIGPTIIGASLVDRGFFWMDKVRLYSERLGEGAFLYQEFTMQFSLEKISALITALQSAGFTDEEAQDVFAKMMGGSAPAAPAPEANAEDEEKKKAEAMQAAAAAPTAAFRAPLHIPGAKAPAPAAPAGVTVAADPKPAAKPAPAPAKPAATPIPALMAALGTKPAAAPVPAAQVQGYAEIDGKVEALRGEVGELTAAFRSLLLRELDREGRLVGIPDPARLMAEAPAYFSELISQKAPLAQASPAPAGGNPLRVVAAAGAQVGEVDAEQFARDVKAFREGELKKGRKLTQAQAIDELERQRKGQASGR
jgi:hypothetical protein